MGTQKQSGCSCTEKRPYEDTARRHHLWARERHLRGNQTCWHLDIGRLASRAGRKLFLLFRPSSQWYSIVAALANYYTGLKSLALRRRKDQSSMRSRFKLLLLLKHKLGLSKSLLINQKKKKKKTKKKSKHKDWHLTINTPGISSWIASLFWENAPNELLITTHLTEPYYAKAWQDSAAFLVNNEL